MKKKLIIGGGLLLVVVLCFSLFLIFRKDKEEVELKDYSYVNVEEIVSNDINTLGLDNFIIKDAKIKNGYLEGIFFNNSEDNYEVLKIVIIIYDEEGNILDEINFEYEKVFSYDERDLFYPIQKDLSKAYYIEVKER